MARYHGKNARILIDEYDSSGVSNTWTVNIARDTAEVTAFADTSKEYLVGDPSATADFSAYFDTGTAGFDETSFGYIVTTNQQRYCGFFPYGYTAGYVVYEVPGYLTSRPVSSPVGDAITLDGSVTGDTAGRGLVLLNASVTATGTNAGVDYGAKGAGPTLMVVYRTSALEGAGNMVHALETSTDDGGADAYSAVAALASGTLTANGTVAKSTTAATERYLRVNTTTFAPTSATVRVTAVTTGG